MNFAKLFCTFLCINVLHQPGVFDSSKVYDLIVITECL